MKKTCIVRDCTNVAWARGWYDRHYQLWRRNGEPKTVRRVGRGTCAVSGCGRPWDSRGWCKLHWKRWKRTGNPTMLRRLGKRYGIQVLQGRAWVRIVSGMVARAQAVWVQHNGPIPWPGIGKHKGQFHVHHTNEDTLDDRIENLQLLSHSEHIRLHARARRAALLAQPTRTAAPC